MSQEQFRIPKDSSLDERIDYCLRYRIIIDPVTKCWNWIGAKCSGGYGVIRIDNQLIGTHVFFFEQFKGKLLEGQEPHHVCHNSGCVNPEHLESKTHQENLQERLPKTRCINGHLYTEENTYRVLKSGYRKCRICYRQSKNKYLERQSIKWNQKTLMA